MTCEEVGELALRGEKKCVIEKEVSRPLKVLSRSLMCRPAQTWRRGQALGSGVCEVCLRQPGEARGSRGPLLEAAHWGCYIIHGQT